MFDSAPIRPTDPSYLESISRHYDVRAHRNQWANPLAAIRRERTVVLWDYFGPDDFFHDERLPLDENDAANDVAPSQARCCLKQG